MQRRQSKRKHHILPVLAAASAVLTSNAFLLSREASVRSAGRCSVSSCQPQQSATPWTRIRTRSLASGSSNDDSTSKGSGIRNELRRQQEAELEAMSSRGSSRIAQMDIAERTKRALLAEAVENRIFALQQELLELAQNNGRYSAAKVVAQQIQLAQSQYRELVSGDPSDMLRAYESLAATSSSPTRSSNDDEDDSE